jgi:hypothetical protein
MQWSKWIRLFEPSRYTLSILKLNGDATSFPWGTQSVDWDGLQRGLLYGMSMISKPRENHGGIFYYEAKPYV